jgi:hypothetical protein
MSTGNVRKGVTQAKFNEENVNIVIGEIAILSIAVGLYFQSWYVGGGVLLGLMLGILIPYVSVILAIIFSIFWSLLAAGIASLLSESYINTSIFELDINATLFSQIQSSLELIFSLYSTGAGLVVGIIALLASLGIHLSAIEWSKDISDTEDRNF